MLLRSLTLFGSLTAASATLAVAEDSLRIADLAPEGTFLVLGADGISATCEHFNAGPLAGLWRSEAVKDAFGDDLEEMLGEMNEALEAEGVDGGLSMPEAVGFAVYTDLDEDTGTSRAYVLGFAEWTGDDEDAGRLFDYMMEQLRDDDSMKLDDRELRGREVVVIERIEDDDDMDDDFGGGEFDALMMIGDPSEFAPDLDEIFMVHENGRFLFANDLLALDDALATIDGDGGDRQLSGTDDWRNTMEQLGANDGYLVLRTEPIQQLLAPMFMGPLGLVKPLIGEVFGDVRAYGFGLSIPEGDEVSMTLTASMLMPEGKDGLFSIIDSTGTVGTAPPRAVGVDAIGYGTMHVAFDKVMPLMEDFSAALPMGGEEMDMMLDQMGPMVSAALATMGPEVHVVSTLSRPIKADSLANTALIPTSDPKKVQPMLALLGPGMDLEPRDFLGETVWSNEESGTAVAVAGNWVVAGNPRGVEQVLRSLGDGGDGNDLAEADTFRNSVAKLPGGDAVGWGWVDVVSLYAAQRTLADNMMEMLGGGGFDEFAPMDADLDQLAFAGDLMDALTPDELAKYVGSSVWSFTSDDLGFVYRQWQLGPGN